MYHFLQILVHGEQNEMQRLKSALEREYENDPDTTITVHNPKNTQSVDLYFTGEKTVKVIFSVFNCVNLRLVIKFLIILGNWVISCRETNRWTKFERYFSKKEFQLSYGCT